MKIILELKDRIGNILNEGDIVAISDQREIQFYSEVKYLPEKKCIAPFHTFSFHSFIKMDSLPEGAEELDTESNGYRIWVGPKKKDDFKQTIKDYLLSWRECERIMGDSMFSIYVENKNKNNQTSLF